MVITFVDRGNCPIKFSDFCSRIIWAIKPKIVKDMMLHGIEYVRDNYTNYKRQLSINKNLDKFEYYDEYHKWFFGKKNVSDNAFQKIMDYQGDCIVKALCKGYEIDEIIYYPIRIESVSDNHISIYLHMTGVPLTWLSLIAKIYDVIIDVINPDDLSENPFIYIENYHIIKRENAEYVDIIVYDETRHSIVRKTINKEMSGLYSFENLSESLLELPESTVPTMVYNNNSQPCQYNPITEFKVNGGSTKRPTVETYINRVLPYSLRDELKNVLKRFDMESETGKQLKNEINLFIKKGWDDYIVFLANLLPRIKEKSISFKGSAMNSLLLQYSTHCDLANDTEDTDTSFNGPLVLECNLVGPSGIIDELRYDVLCTIVYLAKDYWYWLHKLGDNVFIISMDYLSSNDKNDLDSGKANLNKYLTIKINTFLGI